MKVMGICVLSIRKLMVGRSVPTEPRASGGEHFLDGVEDGDSRETFDGSPGRTRPTSDSETLPIRVIHTQLKASIDAMIIDARQLSPQQRRQVEMANDLMCWNINKDRIQQREVVSAERVPCRSLL
jgi:hypothetical protein